MNVVYKNNKIKRKLSTATEIKRNFGVNSKRVAQRMAEIFASPNLSILMQIPMANCHQLTGDRNGEWSVDISANHRMIFEINHNPIPSNDDGSVNTILVTDIQINETTDPH